MLAKEILHVSDGNLGALIGHGEASAYDMLGVEGRVTTLYRAS